MFNQNQVSTDKKITLEALPFDVILNIVYYLSIQELYQVAPVNKLFLDIATYILQIKAKEHFPFLEDLSQERLPDLIASWLNVSAVWKKNHNTEYKSSLNIPSNKIQKKIYLLKEYSLMKEKLLVEELFYSIKEYSLMKEASLLKKIKKTLKILLPYHPNFKNNKGMLLDDLIQEINLPELNYCYYQIIKEKFYQPFFLNWPMKYLLSQKNGVLSFKDVNFSDQPNLLLQNRNLLHQATLFLDSKKLAALLKYLTSKKEITQNENELITAADDNGYVPLHFAIKTNKLEAVKIFIEYYVSKNIAIKKIKDKKGGSLLSFATRYGHIDLVKLLWEHCVNEYTQNDQDRDNDFFGNNLIGIKLYKKNRISIMQYHLNDFKTLLHLATLSKSIAVIKYVGEFLRKHFEFITLKYNELKPLSNQMPFSKQIMTCLIIFDNDLNDDTPLHYAIRDNNFEIFVYLLNLGFQDMQLHTYHFYIAKYRNLISITEEIIKNNRSKMFEYFLENIFIVPTHFNYPINPNKETLLHCAATYASLDIAKLLLNFKESPLTLNVDPLNINNETPLFKAITILLNDASLSLSQQRLYLNMIKLLLSQGASPNIIIQNDGQTLFFYVIFELMKKESTQAYYDLYLELVQVLLSNDNNYPLKIKVDLNIADKNGNTSLKLVINSGVEAHQQNRAGLGLWATLAVNDVHQKFKKSLAELLVQCDKKPTPAKI